MRIAIAGFAMGGPTGMTDAYSCMKILSDQGVFQISDLSFFLENFQPAVQQGDTGAIISPVLKSFQTFQNNRVRLAGADVGYNSTHKV
jgi:hypothetical protein